MKYVQYQYSSIKTLKKIQPLINVLNGGPNIFYVFLVNEIYVVLFIFIFAKFQSNFQNKH